MPATVWNTITGYKSKYRIMTTTNDESPFLVDGEAWRQDQRLKSIAKRVRDWHHKQQLDLLPDFSARLHYWLENVDGCPGSVDWPAEGDDKPAFTLTVDPKTRDDEGLINRWYVDFHRAQFAELNKGVEKFTWKYGDTDPIRIAFIVRPFDVLKADLELRLTTAIRKDALLHCELTVTTEAIDAACRMSNGINPALALDVRELRYNLGTNRSYDFTFPYLPTHDRDSKIVRLAKVWDIVHYEAYLKDRLVEIGNSTLSSHNQRQGKQNEDPPKYTSFSELFFDPLYEVPCVDVLRNYRPEKRILEGNVWRGGVKRRGLIVAWIERMENMNPPKIRHLSDRKQLVELLNKYFTNLNMGEAVRVWSDPVDGKIKDEFTSLLPE